MLTVFSNYNGSVYITRTDNNVIKVYKDHANEPFIEYSYGDKFFTSGVFGDNRLVYSCENNDGQLYFADSCEEGGHIHTLDLSEEYSNLYCVKYLSGGSKHSYLLKGLRRENNETEYFIYDVMAKKVLAYVPLVSRIHHNDLEYVDEETIMQMTDKVLLKDDGDDEMQYHVLVWKIEDYQNRKDTSEQEKDLERYIGVYTMEDFWTCQMHSRESSYGMHFPLFDKFLYHWHQNKSLTSKGNGYLFFNEDIHGIFIGDINGDVMYYFEIPEMVRTSYLYFDEDKKELYALKDDSAVFIYKIDQNEEYVKAVNDFYNTTYLDDLQNNFEFKKIFHKALFSAIVKEIGRIEF